ncbi:MAG TPA: EamA family transporter [Stenotrophomonas sp.]|nr:EamA family transporter [Stenotrophomonas sp.]
MSPAHRTTLPILAVLGSIASLCVGTSLAKHLFPVIGAPATTLLRVGFAAVLMLAIQRPWKAWPAPRALGLVAAYGVVLGAMNLSFYLALRTIPFGIAVAIEFTGPLAVALLSSRRALDFVWIAFAVAGLALLVPRASLDAALDPAGVAWSLAAALCWALYIVIGQRAGQAAGAATVPLGLVVAALVVAPFGAAHVGDVFATPALLAFAAGVALLSSAIPYSLEIYALRHLPRQTFGILLSLEPAVAALAGWLLLSEILGSRQWLAIGCIMIASAGAALAARRRKPTVRAVEG